MALQELLYLQSKPRQHCSKLQSPGQSMFQEAHTHMSMYCCCSSCIAFFTRAANYFTFLTSYSLPSPHLVGFVLSSLGALQADLAVLELIIHWLSDQALITRMVITVQTILSHALKKRGRKPTSGYISLYYYIMTDVNESCWPLMKSLLHYCRRNGANSTLAWIPFVAPVVVVLSGFPWESKISAQFFIMFKCTETQVSY